MACLAMFGALLLSLPTMWFSGPPESCVRLVEKFHNAYNQGDLSMLRGRQGDVTQHFWGNQTVEDVRQHAGRFEKISSLNYGISMRSLASFEVSIWLVSDLSIGVFKNGSFSRAALWASPG